MPVQAIPIRGGEARLACALVISGAAGTASATTPPKVPIIQPPAAGPPPFVQGARWFPVVDDTDPRLTVPDPDGGVRMVERGLRLIEHPDGRIERASDLLPADGPLGELSLPDRLGGGFVFYVTDRTTRLWRTPTWTSRLVPLTRLPFDASAIDAGFDRLYASSVGTRALVGIDAKSGALIGEGSIPRAPSYGGVAFSDAWMGAVEVDIRGALVTFDAGATFHPVQAPLATPGVFEQAGRAVIGTKNGAFALAPSGELERMDGPSSDAVFGDLANKAAPGSDEDEGSPSDQLDVPTLRANVLGSRPLEVAALHGLPDTPGTVVVVANGALARVDLRDGRILAVNDHAVASGTTCQAIRLFAGLGFVCGEDRGRTTVYALRAPLTLEPVFAFAEARVVLSGGNGAIAIRGGCSERAPSRATYCIVGVAGAPHEITVQGDVGAERVVALADGRAVVIVPPRPRFSGAITVVGPGNRVATHALVLDALAADAATVIRGGLWLDGVSEIEPGKLSAWVAGSAPFVGVRVTLDGLVTAGTVRTRVDRASFSGAVGFVTGERGGGYETTDGGMTWSEIDVPASADLADAPSTNERGCTPVGASIGSWVRVGWGKGGDALAVAAEPAAPKPEPTPFVVWSLDCSPTGETEGPAQAAAAAGGASRRFAESRVAPPKVTTGAVRELESSAFRPFLGVPSPSLMPGDLGFDFGTEDQAVQARGYAWGGRDAEWDRAGTWLVRIADRFAVRHAIWSSAPSRSPWADAGAAAEAFGSEPSHRISNEWSAVVDPVENAGILVMRTGPATQLAAVEKDRAIVVAENADQFSLDRLAGAAKVQGRWYIGDVPGPRAFQILSFDRGVLSALASYPRYADPRYSSGDAHVVRTARGDALGIWVIGKGQRGTSGGGDSWFVYPVDPRSGAAGNPVIVNRDALTHVPRPCGPDEDDGWVLVHDVSPSVTRIEFSNMVETPAIGRLEARLLLGPAGLCLDALSAQVDGDPPKNLAPAGRTEHARLGAALALTDRATDRRWGFRCAP